MVTSVRISGVQAPGEELEVTRSASGLPVVRVEVGGEALRFAIDTGTSRSLLSANAARRLGLVPGEAFSVASAAGPSSAAVCAAAPEIRLGGLRIPLECLGWIPAETRLAGVEDVDGLLGADALAHVDLWIDLSTRRPRARVAPSGSLGSSVDGRRLSVDLVGRRPALSAEVVIPGHRGLGGRLIVDLGSDALILFGTLARRVADMRLARHSGGTAVTPTGTRQVQIAAIHGVRTSGTIFELRTAGLLPDVQRPEDGVLPLHVLSPVLFDLANGSVVARARLRRSTGNEPRTGFPIR
jgi:hypothetical protein